MSQAPVQYNSTQYDRIRVLGKGSFGTATVHRRRADCSLVVLKEIDLQKFKGEREKMSAINEARIMSTLSHSNIIKFHNAYTTDTKLIIEMEYAGIGTLANYLTFQVQPLEEREVLIIYRQIVSGVYYLHSKDIVHLDLKMTNIFITIDGLVKIGDFGISQYMNTAASATAAAAAAAAAASFSPSNNQLASGNMVTQHRAKRPLATTSTRLGTLAYSSPERCLGEPTDFKSDIWSLGCILYELIASKPLFAAASLPDLVLSITEIQYNPIKRQIMPLLLETFEQTIARDPEDRPSAKELLHITGQLLSRLQLKTTRNNHIKHHNHHQHHHQSHRFELSTEMALFAGHQQDDISQLNYLHSLVYQVRLDSKHIQVDRVNLPQTKRIKEICKGKSHYLVLTYDNIVYGWGSKTYGQLGACGLSSSGGGSANSYGSTSMSTFGGHRATRSARSSVKGATRDHLSTLSNTPCTTAASSPSSSSQTIAGPTCGNISTVTSTPRPANSQYVSKQLIMSILQESKPTTRPFIMNELNNRKIIQVAAGKNFSVFLSRTGIVMTCGDGSSGCLGRGNLGSSFTPCMVEGLLNADVVSIGCGPEHVVAVCGNGRAYSWGNGGQGRLGVVLGGREARKSEVGTSNDESISLNIAGASRTSASSATTKTNGASVSRGLGNRGKYVLHPEPVQFEANVFIKRVFCGDRCTVFIDSDNRCWACGENRFNKLGLDIKRRFKKSLIVERRLYPTEIVALSKYKIVTCNIGKNHTSFISNEGKLLVFGQDIDHTYRLRSNIISSRDSHRRISYQLQNRANKTNIPRNAPTSQRSPQSFRRYRDESLISQNMKDGHKSSSKTTTAKLNSGRLSKLQRQQMDSYIKKSRSNRRMPFDCTIGVSCRPKFTLVLTSDNRVYFWGVRSHRKEEEEQQQQVEKGTGSGHITCPARTQNELDQNGLIKRDESIEPQLVTNCSADECFIKIGETNNSLMSSIQTLGSDQPIIHAQDPRLMAKSLADLWILDYQPSGSTSTSASTCSSLSSLDNGGPISASSSYCSLSPCSHCTRCGSSSRASNLAACNQNPDESGWSQRRRWQQYKVDPTLQSQPHGRPKRHSWSLDYGDGGNGCDYIDDSMRHDAILEPQPIVSLYVPSMFNHKGCSLNLVDLFCFDNDRFYLILDTSITLQQTQKSQSRPPSCLATTGIPLQTDEAAAAASATRKRLMSANETGLARSQIRQLAHNESSSLVNLHQATGGHHHQRQYSTRTLDSDRITNECPPSPTPPPPPPPPAPSSSPSLIRIGLDGASGLPKQKASTNHENGGNNHLIGHSPHAQVVENGGNLREEAEEGDGCNKDADLHDDHDDDENNNKPGGSGGGDDGVGGFSSGDASKDNNTNDHTVISGGVSLEEPRSLSTFATSLGNHHIIVGPTMRSLEHQEQTLHPLSFGGRNHQHLPFGSRRNPGIEFGSPIMTTGVHLLEERTGSESSSCNGTLMNGFKGMEHEVDSRTLNKLDCDIIMTNDDDDDDGGEFSAGNYLGAGRRKRINKSESTTNCASNDIDETSSMPSWVRNEFIEQQRQHNSGDNYDDDDEMYLQEGNNGGHTLEATIIGSLATGGDSSTAATENNTCMSSLRSSNSNDVAAAGDGQDDSDQTLAHGIYSESIVDEVEKGEGGNHVEDHPLSRSLGGIEDSARSTYELDINCCGPANRDDKLDGGPEDGTLVCVTMKHGEIEEELGARKPPRPQLAYSQSHPNMRELDQKEISDSIPRRASILLDSQRETAGTSSQANILDCNIYKIASVSHKTTLLQRQHDDNNISLSHINNDATILYDSCHPHHHRNHQSQLHLSGNMLNSALSSRSNSHNPLIRADFNPKLGFLKEHEQQKHRNNHHTHSETHLGLAKNGHSQEFNQPGNNDNKTRAASSSSLASLRKSLAKLFC